MNRILKLMIFMAIGLVVAACSGKKDQGTVLKDSTVVDDVANAYGTGYSAQELRDRFGIEGDPLNYTTLYFTYKSAEIDERSRIITSAHARHLAAQSSSINVKLEGHADERGTRDYNLALGERRAKSVADLMNANGVGSSSIQTISYGEERPVDTGHNESAWQQNRRVEIVY